MLGRSRGARAFVALVLAMVMAIAFAAPALGMESAKVTVSEQTGGLPTRFTFEGQTTPGEAPITEMRFTFPEGFDLDKQRVESLTLEGLQRKPVASQVAVNGQTLTVKFEPPVPTSYSDSEGKQQATILRVQIFDVVMPSKGGEYELKTEYVSGGVATPVPGLTFEFKTPDPGEAAQRYLEQQVWVQKFNSVKVFGIFFAPQLIALSIPLLFTGWLLSIALVLVAFPFSVIGGLLGAFAKMSKLAIVRWIAAAYVNVIRGTPLFLQIFVAFIGLRIAGLRLDNFTTGVIVLTINSSAYLTEIFRAGIQSIHKGQFEAASSLGMNYWQSMRYVIVPQTVKRVLPTMTSEFILLFKDTALLSAVGVIELMYRANSIVSRTGNLTPFVVAAVYYLLVTIPLINWVGRLERKLAIAEGAQGAVAEPKKRAATTGLTRTAAPGELVAGDEVIKNTISEQDGR